MNDLPGRLACALLFALTLNGTSSRADIYRWDNGQLIPGTRGITPGPEFEFYSGNLSFADLSHRDLTRARLASSNLRNAAFTNSNLTGADLYGTDLSGADLTGAVVNWAYFDFTTSNGLTKEQLYSTASYEAKDLRGIGLSSNDLTGWDFKGQDLTGAHFHHAKLENTDFTESSVSGVDFEAGPQTTSGRLTKEQLYSTSSYQAKQLPGLSLRFNDLTGWKFRAQDLTAVNFEFAKLADADFIDAKLVGANLGSATTYGFTKEQLYSTASYKAKNLRGINFGEAVQHLYPGPRNNLTGWDFSGQDLTGATLSGATLTNLNLEGAIVSGANLWYVTLTGFSKEQLYSTASYKQGNLQGIILSGNDLTGWDLRNQDLTDASFSYSTLTNASFAGAIVAGAGLESATTRGFTRDQLYSTASYQAKDLRGIGLYTSDLTAWDFSGQNLTGANFYGATLTDANFTGAVVARAVFSATTSKGFTQAKLYSTASHQAKDLHGIRLDGNSLVRWDFSGQDLTGANFYEATLAFASFRGANLTNADMVHAQLTQADFTGAIVKGAAFNTANNQRLTKEQLYSTASYQAKDLQGIGLGAYYSSTVSYFDLTGWDFSGQNLNNAAFDRAVLTNAHLTGADTRGARGLNLANAVTRNAILPDGKITGLTLTAGERMPIRDDDGLTGWLPNGNTIRSPISLKIENQLNMAEGSTLQFQFDADPWDSVISFEPGIPMQLGGTLELVFADDVDLSTQRGRALRIFDWTGVSPSGEFTIHSPYVWDLTKLYSTGEVTLVAVPEPAAASIMFIAILLLVARGRIIPLGLRQ